MSSYIPRSRRISYDDAVPLARSGFDPGVLCRTRSGLRAVGVLAAPQVGRRDELVVVARKKVYLYQVRMLMRQGGGHTVAVGLHNEIGAVTSFVAGDVRVAGN